ncbi:4-hydroxy-tetrahydrodipicolinate synthase [Oceanivirga miroungae]|uniref:4-hydroxy-tetrahydrodipicolinate synthase n=1 Tax=Oceanivirga miroungae TaxID=1130046 RepID=A0A6I8M7T2_9FUSO|nr:4-hydroxy-tetrahydrodipicolinate synthase [Oceanivirga miroungae]VWL85550.1 dihydrodipicolinate synthase [Oceanivirga miroungae]
MTKLKLKGVFTAIVTPFNKDYEIDYIALEKLIEFQIENKVSGIVVCGTTGETPTLSNDEYKSVIEFVVKKVNKRVLVIAGASSNSTLKALENAKLCKSLGVDAILVSAPYYNKPTQKGIIMHFEKINEIGIPIVIYNVPSRTGVNILADTTYTLSKLENIVAIKEASGIIEQMIDIKLKCKDSISILSGEDHLIMPMSVIGCDGVISVVSNILPKILSDFYIYDEKKYEIHEFLYEISRSMFIEGNPVTVKEAMSILDLCENYVRLPLANASENTTNTLKELFRKKGLIQ